MSKPRMYEKNDTVMVSDVMSDVRGVVGARSEYDYYNHRLVNVFFDGPKSASTWVRTDRLEKIRSKKR